MTLHKGPYGYYVQLGEAADGAKPPRASIPKGMDPAPLTLERALDLLSLPRRIGTHPDDGEPVEAGIGRFGPYVKHGRTYANIRDPEEVFTIGMNRAMEVLAQKAQRGGRGAAATPLRELGTHPDGGTVALLRRPLRALREVGEDQRHPPQGDRPRGGDPRGGARPPRRQGAQAQERPARKAAAAARPAKPARRRGAERRAAAEVARRRATQPG